MQIKELTDKLIWEKFISLYSPQSLFQSWNWGETIIKVQNEISKSKNLWRLGLYGKDEIIGIAQIEKVQAKRGTFLHIRHGPIFSRWERGYFDYFFNYLKILAKEEKASFLRISPLIENSLHNRNFFCSFGFKDAPIHAMDGEYCWVIDLDTDENTLLGNMRKTTRYLIRQAQKIGVTIKKSKDQKDLDEFMILYRDTAERQHFIPHTGIWEEFSAFSKDDQIILLKGYYQNKLLSAALIIFYNHQTIYHHSASIEQKIPVNYLLQWEIIKEAIKRGKKRYNMWGICPEDKKRHPWKGLTLFKKGFGGRSVEYLHAKDYPLSSSYCTTYIIEWLRKNIKGY